MHKSAGDTDFPHGILFDPYLPCIVRIASAKFKSSEISPAVANIANDTPLIAGKPEGEGG